MSERPYSRYLWSEEREEYRKGEGPEVDCVFCAQAEGDERVVKKCVFEDDFLMVVMNIFPYNPGHLMVVPKRHINSFTELKDEEIKRLFKMVSKVEELQKGVFDLVGIDMGANIGVGAGESIEHLHVQMVPIYDHDRGFMETALNTKVMPEKLDRTFEKLKGKKGEYLDDYWG